MTKDDDHNQSSRLDLELDYDPEADYYSDSGSSHRLNQIQESQSYASVSASASASASDMESTVEVEDLTNNAIEVEGLRGGGQRRQQMHSHETNGVSQNHKREATNRKLVKIKLWDPGDESAQPSVLTVAVDALSIQVLGDVHDMSLGVGQTIELQHKISKEGRHLFEGGEEQRVEITSRQSRRWKEETWQPPLTISEEDRARASGAHADNQRNQPQSMPTEHPTTTAEVSSETAAISDPKTETSETIPTRVKGLEPFTIPSILSSTVIKRTPTEKVGLAFRKANGTVAIEKIVPGSAFDGTALRPGYECLCINGHRLRSARRAAEIVRDSGTSLTLVASDAPRPPGTMYTMISLDNDSASMSSGRDYTVGMHFQMKHGLVQLCMVDADSPIGSTSMKVGDFVLAINGSAIGTISKAVEVLSEFNEDMVPILYFNMRQLRVSLVDKVIGDLWKKEWSDGYDECVVLQPGSGSNPLTLRFQEEGMCELLDPLRAFRDKSSENASSVVPPDHPLNSVVETLNHGIVCVLSAIREGVELATFPKAGSPSIGSSHDGGGSSLMSELAKLSGMYTEGLLSKDDFEAIKTKLLKS
mmetsp:Transcript_26611/g.57207  ORF Transcript_26611/g.57207 Transcript_26611/m.57207 type:complete len:589 (-) Transcript_26611:98-1864(-)